MSKIRDRIKSLRRVRAGDLKPNPRNWRTHPEHQKAALQGVLEEVGYADACLARELPDGTLELVDGHLRQGLDPDQKLPVLILDITEAEADKLLTVLDPLAAMAGADDQKLGELLAAIETESEGLQAMLEGLADDNGLDVFQTEEVQEIEPQIDQAAELQKKWGTEAGQLWVVPSKTVEGREHRVLCGDSTKAEDVGRLMGKSKATLCHADPPYGMGKEKDGIANDNLYREKLDAFQMAWWGAIRPFVANNGSAYIWGNAEDLWRLWYCGGLRDSERLSFRNDIVWHRGPSAGPGGSGIGSEGQRSYVPATEHILFFMLGEQGFNNNADNYWEGWEPIRAQLAADCDRMGWGSADIKRITGVGMYSHWFTKSQWTFIPEEHYIKLQAAARGHDAFNRDHGAFKQEHCAFKQDYDDLFKQEHDELKQEFYATRAYFDNTHDNMTDVWDFSRVTGEERHGHATPKAIEMIARCVKTSSRAGDVIVDPFLGTAPTMVAAEQFGRLCYGLELEPKYVAVILQRMADMGLTPQLEDSTNE